MLKISYLEPIICDTELPGSEGFIFLVIISLLLEVANTIKLGNEIKLYFTSNCADSIYAKNSYNNNNNNKEQHQHG